MKKAIGLWGLGVLIVLGCGPGNARIQEFMPGTYVNSATGEMASAEDTLVVERVKDNQYLVTRRTSYRAIRNGKALPGKYRVRKLPCVFDAAQGVLNETTGGQVFRFDPDKGFLLVRQAVYTKIR